MLPKLLVKFLNEKRAQNSWKDRSFTGNSPQFVKEAVFLTHGIKDGIWIETGTYLGATTDFLSNSFPHVYSIEPEPKLFFNAKKKFQDKQNVSLVNDTSEKAFPEILKNLSGNVNFWLDGHFSDGITFKGEKDCPIEEELEAIKRNLNNFDQITILIDDARCFRVDNTAFPNYPSLDFLVDWARQMNFCWTIEHDIFIMKNYK